MTLLLMLSVFGVSIYLIFAKFYPAMSFRYLLAGERKAHAEYARLKREQPDAASIRVSEAEFVDDFVRNGPSPWKWAAIVMLLLCVGLPASCALGLAGGSTQVSGRR
jgi:hypothetical protein